MDETAGTDNREAAEAIRIKREAELLNRSIFGERATATFLEAAVSYLEICPEGERQYVKRLAEHFGATLLSAIDQAAVDRAGRALYPDAGPATVNRQCITPLAAVLHHAARRNLCEWRRFERPKMPKGRTRWVRPDEAEALIAAAPDRICVLVIFLLCTGCRLGEALALDWADIDLARRRAAFLDTKNGDHRGIALAERAFLELANMKGERTGRVFPIPRASIYYPWAKMCKAAGVVDFRPHDCRHTWATWMRAEGNLDLRGLMAAGGWRDHKSVIRYTHVNPDDLKPAIDAITFGKVPKKDRNMA